MLGVSVHLCSIVLFACMAAGVKYLGGTLPTGEIMFARCSVAVLALTATAYFTDGLHILKTRNWRLHATRSFAGTFNMFCYFTSLHLLPLADVTAITFTTPMFVTLMAMLLLGERIHAFRWSALGIGFVGALIMLAPYLQLNEASFGVVAAFAGALASAGALISLRSMSGGEHAVTITFYFMLTAMLASLLTLPWGWVMPTPMQFTILLITGACGYGAQLLLTYSFRFAEASTIAPLQYTSMIMAIIVGFVLFGEVPSWSIWAGAPLVIASGLIIFWREYQRQRERVAAAAKIENAVTD